MVENGPITERVFQVLGQPEKLRELSALLEVGVPLDDLAAQIATGLVREGGIAPQNAVMILPSIAVMLTRIAESFKIKFRLSSDDKHGGISEAEVMAAVQQSQKSSPDLNNKVARGFRAAATSAKDLTKNADNVGFLQDAKEKI